MTMLSYCHLMKVIVLIPYLIFSILAIHPNQLNLDIATTHVSSKYLSLLVFTSTFAGVKFSFGQLEPVLMWEKTPPVSPWICPKSLLKEKTRQEKAFANTNLQIPLRTEVNQFPVIFLLFLPSAIRKDSEAPVRGCVVHQVVLYLIRVATRGRQTHI